MYGEITVLTLFFLQILYYDIHLQWLFLLFPMILMKPLNENSIHISKCQRVNLMFPILEWVAVPFSRGSSQPRDRTQAPPSQADSLPLSHQGSPRIQKWVSCPFSSKSSQPRNQTKFPSVQADSLPAELRGIPPNAEG